MLQSDNLGRGYGASLVLHGINLTLQQSKIVTLIGSNGAGKSTLVQCISGLKTPMAGRMRFNGKPIEALQPAERLRLDISHVPEGRQVFAAMTVAENLGRGAQGVAAIATVPESDLPIQPSISPRVFAPVGVRAPA